MYMSLSPFVTSSMTIFSTCQKFNSSRNSPLRFVVFMVMNIQIMVYWDLTAYGSLGRQNYTTEEHFHPEDEGRMFLQHFGTI